jgi:hypothetical protein
LNSGGQAGPRDANDSCSVMLDDNLGQTIDKNANANSARTDKSDNFAFGEPSNMGDTSLTALADDSLIASPKADFEANNANDRNASVKSSRSQFMGDVPDQPILEKTAAKKKDKQVPKEPAQEKCCCTIF